TGPLGQGFANAVGMAFASKMFAKEFNNAKNSIIDHYIYAILSDGDLMEGISSEAASFAGHIGLGNIIYIYDDNRITIEGSTDAAFSEDVQSRFASYNWHVQKIDGHNFYEIEEAIVNAQKEENKPSIIIARTRIAKGSPNKEGSEHSHGSPLGVEEIKQAKMNIGCDPDLHFFVPQRVYDIMAERGRELADKHNEWNRRFKDQIKGELKKKWDTFFNLPDILSLKDDLPVFETGKAVATRSASGKVLEALFGKLPNIIGGSADLAPSNKSFVSGYEETGRGSIGRNIHFGIREHAMGAIQNGISSYGGFLPYSATFLAFADYMRPAIRLASMSGLHTVYLFTHDSIFVGEDGPTHQPIEHIASLRAIPKLTVIRPADAEETREAWLSAIDNRFGPTALILTRHDIPVIERKFGKAQNLNKGAYIIWDADSDPDILLIATGSEVHISIEAAKKLKDKGINARVISFPSWELFEKQSEDYKKMIFPEAVNKRIVIEAGIKMGWEKYAGIDGLYITIDQFGASAPYKVLAERFGFTEENILAKVIEYFKQ
ncbi:MAG: transketolase, partial [Spirochaetota bacterium]|nr:transketolase [Spirochaetota bacterium]